MRDMTTQRDMTPQLEVGSEIDSRAPRPIEELAFRESQGIAVTLLWASSIVRATAWVLLAWVS